MKTLFDCKQANRTVPARLGSAEKLLIGFLAAAVLLTSSRAAFAEVAKPAIPPKNSRVVNLPPGALPGPQPSALVSFLPNVQVNVDPGNLKDDFGPAIAVDQSGTIYVVWNIEEPGDTGIYFSRSTDRGVTFSPAVRVNDNVAYPPSFDAYQPDVAFDSTGNIYVVWHDYRAWADDNAYTSPIDIYLDKSMDGGATWGTDVKVTSGTGYYPWSFQPYIAVNQKTGHIDISYTDYNRYWPEGDYGDVYVSRSVDGGASFGAKVKVDDTGDTTEQGFSSIAVDPLSGGVFVAFYDLRGGDRDIYVAKSTDDGQIFGTNVRANDVTTNDQEEPTVRVDGLGNVFVVWKDWRDDSDPTTAPYLNDIYLARSTDGAATFGPSVRVTDEYMNADYGYNFPPRLAVDPSGYVHVTWHDLRNGSSMCYYDRSLDGGLSFSQDTVVHDNLDNISHSLPRLAEDGRGGVHFAWMDKRNGNGKFDIFYTTTPSYHAWEHRHAVGDFDGDGIDELAADFGTAGAWLWNGGVWTLLTASNPDILIAANTDGDNDDEIVAVLGATGLWLWNGGAWTQLSGVAVENIAVGDTDADGSDELVGDFGAAGLWLWNGGAWTQLSGVNADFLAVADVDGLPGDEVIGGFGGVGLWLWEAGVWTQLSGVTADSVEARRAGGSGGRDLVGDFGATGLWLYHAGAWTEMSGRDADGMSVLDADGDSSDEVAGDFGPVGLWLWNAGTWGQLSGVNADFMVRADTDGDLEDEIVVDFGTLGLWLWDGGAWTQLSGVNPEYLVVGDFDGDNQDEIVADFGTLGVWEWNGGVWAKISANNPD
jgi:hypothetical protein